MKRTLFYYYQKQWHTHPRVPAYERKDKIVSPPDETPPLYRPGWWVQFHERVHCPDYSPLVGRIIYVERRFTSPTDLLDTYEIEFGPTWFAVAHNDIICRMIKQ